MIKEKVLKLDSSNEVFIISEVNAETLIKIMTVSSVFAESLFEGFWFDEDKNEGIIHSSICSSEPFKVFDIKEF